MKFERSLKRGPRIGRARWLIGVAMLSIGCLGACSSAGSEEVEASSPAVVPIDGAAAAPVDDATSTTAPTTTVTESGDSVAELPPSTEAPPPGNEPTIEVAQQAYRDFTECMQNEGITMPPAVFDAQGRIDIDAQITYFEGIDPSAVQNSAAQEAAAELQCIPENAEALLALITPDASSIREVETEITAELDGQLTDLARCMRRDFPDFPDPLSLDLDLTADGDQDFDPFPGISTGDPLYADALQACGREVGLDVPSP